MVVDFTVGGWTPKSGNMENLAEKLRKLRLKTNDRMVIEPMANCAFLGTSDEGLPIPPAKSDEDGRYHLIGDLQLAPIAAFKSICKLLERNLADIGPVKIYLLIPIPRYVSAACCGDAGHVTNRLEADFFQELLGAGRRLTAAVSATALDQEVTLINIMRFFGPAESPFQDLTTADGRSIWAGDGVHLTPAAASSAAAQLMTRLESHNSDEESEPQPKRQRLESVIPTRAPPTATAAAKTRPPVSAPAWLSGKLPAVGRGGNNNSSRGQSGNRGSSGTRGKFAGRGNRRGGRQGRW
jgi:hypothetical protein